MGLLAPRLCVDHRRLWFVKFCVRVPWRSPGARPYPKRGLVRSARQSQCQAEPPSLKKPEVLARPVQREWLAEPLERIPKR